MKQFNVNDSVIHFREGLATIHGVNKMNNRDYFLVRINKTNGETIYVPFASANDIIRAIMTKEEADDLLRYIKTIKKEFNTNTKQRRDAYKRRLASGSVKEISHLYRELYFYYQIGGEGNDEIKLGPVDFELLNYAHNMLMDELALSYDQPRREIEQFVEKRINEL
ncbi:MAG: hypothetical protein GX813_04140 [Erysipelotrichia bacterium]|nr:hypothetical protein [Erysipelotrichia bacterium]